MATIQRHVKQEIAQVDCLRKHGFADMPDPSPPGATGLPPGIDPELAAISGGPEALRCRMNDDGGRRNQRANQPDSGA
jgi:hypothetical protein